MSQIAAVIQISEFDESCEHAVQSVLENHQHFCALVLVKHGFTKQTLSYPTFRADEEALQKAGVQVIWQSQLDVLALPSAARAIIRLEPDVRVSDAAFRALINDMTVYSYDHYAVSSILIIDSRKTRDPRTWFSGLSYGFLLVVLMLDTFRSLVSLFRYSRTVDVCGQLLQITFPNKIRLAPYKWYMWWFGTGICKTQTGDSAAIQFPAEKDQGIGFVLRTIKTHKHMSIGLWWLFYAVYYAVFAFPFWNWLLNPRSVWGQWLVRDLTALYWIIPYLLHTALVAYIAWRNVEFPKTYVPLVGDQSLLLPLQVLLYTFYLTLSPLVFLYARWHVSRAAWQSATDALYKRRTPLSPAPNGAGAGEKEE